MLLLIDCNGQNSLASTTDFIKDKRTQKNRLQVELEKIEDANMRSMLSAFPTETLILHKKDGTTTSVTALVDRNMIHTDDVTVVIEEGDVYERTLPNGAKEYFRVIDRGFYKGDYGIPDNYQSKVEKISKNTAEREFTQSDENEKPHKLFISHSSKDKEYMEALAEMLEDIGMPDGSFVCTSVPGHGIPGGAKIFDWLRDQFLKCDLRVVFALSHNYYTSAASLNEMGASWVTKATDTLLLLPGFGFSDVQGCVDPRELGISFDMDDRELTHRLNEFKDTLISEHHLSTITQARWERHRDKFIKTVREIAAKRDVKENTDNSEDHIAEEYLIELANTKHLIEIKQKIEAAIVDKSWVKTEEDQLKLLRNRSSQFKCNNLMLKDPTILNPDINNGLIKVEPYDFSDDGIIVIVPRGDMRRRIKLKNRGEIEAVVFSEVLFRDIFEIDLRGSQNYPYPTLVCRFHGNHPFNRDVYYDPEIGNIIDKKEIEE